MKKEIMITDASYVRWISDLCVRYRQSQIKAATSVNSEMLRFYWSLGRDIVSMDAENTYGSNFYSSLSRDLQAALPNTKGFSPTNLKYMRRFYELYHNRPQLAAESGSINYPQLVGDFGNAQQAF